MTLHPGIVDAILEQLPSAVFVLNSSGHVIHSNMVGLGLDPDSDRPLPEQVDRYRSRDPVSGRDLRPHESPAARVMAGQVINGAEILVWDPDRQTDRWLSVMGRPVFEADGTVAGGVMVYSDITSERTLARDLTATALAHARLLGEALDRTVRRQRPTHPLVEHLVEQGERTLVDSLSPREMEVLNLLVRGLTNREIGTALHLGPGTVRNHVGRLLAKLGAADRTHAAVLAVTRTLLKPEYMETRGPFRDGPRG